MSNQNCSIRGYEGYERYEEYEGYEGDDEQVNANR